MTDMSTYSLMREERREGSRSREGREENKERRKRIMMCTHLRVKLDNRSVRPRKIKYKVCKVYEVKCKSDSDNEGRR